MPYTFIEPTKANEYESKFGLNSFVAKIFSAMDLSDDQIQQIITPQEPFPIEQDEIIQKIQKRILLAKERKEKVFVAGDYDSDGLCGTAILIRLLDELGIPNGYYIPNRVEEGYGLNVTRMKQAIAKGYTLLITVDNGVSANEALDLCRANKIDTIVLDHHEYQVPAQCDYFFHPFVVKGKRQWLCGAGCALEVVRSFQDIDLGPYLVLAMIATIGDMMELYGQNRWIVQKGLEYLNQNQFLPIDLLMQNVERPFYEGDIAFHAVPKLNAVGRLANGIDTNHVVKYLSSTKDEDVYRLYQLLEDSNEKRKQLTTDMIESIQEEEYASNFPLIYHPDFHTGIVGLVANRILSERHKPVLVAGLSDNKIVGSIRSPKGIDVMEVLNQIPEHFVRFGGHASAAGVTFEQDELIYLKNFLSNLELPEVEKEKVLLIDETELTKENLESLFQYRPFGKGCQLPLIGMSNPIVLQERMLGKPQFRKWFFQNGMTAISFQADKIYEEFDGEGLVFIGYLGTNTFHGVTRYEMQLNKILKSL